MPPPSQRIFHTPYRRRIVVFALFCLMLLAPAPVFSQEARLSNMVVTNTRDDLLLFMKVEGAFTENMKKAILSGVPATFHFIVALEKTRHFWMNREIAKVEISHTITYNPLKKEFTVERSWEKEPAVTDSLAEAEKLMTDVDSVKIASLGDLEKGARYKIRAKAELDKISLPLYLDYVLFFASLWDFETDWYTIEFYF
jgi:hypothetical protein